MPVEAKMVEVLTSAPILIVDDDVEDVQFIKRAFKKNGVTNPLFTVFSGEEAIDYLIRQQNNDEAFPGLMLLDLNMPGVGGLETLRKIKENESWRHIPIVIFTTSKAQEDVVSSYRYGANCFISKPFGLEGLVDVVAKIFDFWFSVAALPKSNRE